MYVYCRQKQRYKLTAISGVKGTLPATLQHKEISTANSTQKYSEITKKHVYYARLLPLPV